MYITLSKLLADPVMKDVHVLTMKNTLEDRIVRSVQILEGADAWQSVGNGEIVFLSGIGMESLETELITFVRKIEKKNAFLVLRTGKYIAQVPDSVIEVCGECQVVLLSLDAEVKMQPITRRIYELLFEEENSHQTVDALMKSLIKGTYSAEEAEKIYQLGFSQEQYHIAVAVCIDHSFDIRGKTEPGNYVSTLAAIRNQLAVVLRRKKQELVFSTIDSGIIYALIDNRDSCTDRKFLISIFRGLEKFVKESFPDITCSMGIGTPFLQLAGCEKSVKEAVRTLQIVYVCRRTDAIRCYDDIGIYRLLFELQDWEEFERIRDGIFGRLVTHDTEKNENLLKTLETYLECDRNIGITAQKMLVHRNTLKYRLNKIEEILLCDLSDVNTCFNLRLGFKIDKFLESERMRFQ